MEVAAELGDRVERVEIEKALCKPGDLTAWEAVIRALAGMVAFRPESLDISVSEARQALSIAPDYALGHAVLALALGSMYAASGGREESLALEARRHVERALALGVSDPLVLTWAAHALGGCGFWQDAERYAQRAVDLNPNLAAGRMVLAMVCVRLKRSDDVMKHVDALESLAPRGSWTHTGIAFRGLAHYMAGRYEPARQAMEKALLLRPDFIYPLKDIAVICEKLGRREAASDAVRRLRSADPSVTLERIEAFNLSSLISPDLATDMNRVIRKVWEETPTELLI